MHEELEDATNRYEDFSGKRGKYVERVKVPSSRVAAKIGKIDGVLYTAIYDGKKQSFVHEFDDRDKPDFAVSNNGRQIHLVGGDYQFTDRGIVDTHGDDDGIDY